MKFGAGIVHSLARRACVGAAVENAKWRLGSRSLSNAAAEVAESLKALLPTGLDQPSLMQSLWDVQVLFDA